MLAQGDIEVSLAVDLANPKLGFNGHAVAKRLRFQPDRSEPIMLHLSAGKGGASARSRDRG